MKPKYIQLPPLPLDMPAEVLEMIWLYAQLSSEEQERIRDFIRRNFENDHKNFHDTGFSKGSPDFDEEVNTDVEEFINLMRKMVGTLIAQSCEMSALVFQNYCIEKKSMEEISEEFDVDEKSIRLVARYYEKKLKL